jgi:DNA-binding MarR family transcriptional regulator
MMAGETLRGRAVSTKRGSRHGKKSSSGFGGRNEQATDEFGLRGPLTYSRTRAIGVKFSVIARQMRKRFDRTVELDGVTRAKWSTVVAISRNPGATQRSIAAMLEITDVAAGQMINRLCEDGYLERREHPTDRRAYCLYVTPSAQPLLVRLAEIAKRLEVETFAGFTAAELAQLDALLDKLASNVTASLNRQEEKKSSTAEN